MIYVKVWTLMGQTVLSRSVHLFQFYNKVCFARGPLFYDVTYKYETICIIQNNSKSSCTKLNVR